MPTVAGSSSGMDTDLTFSSRRSPVVCLHGCVASSQPLASSIGLGEWKTVAMEILNDSQQSDSQSTEDSHFCVFPHKNMHFCIKSQLMKSTEDWEQ